jgi:hypothetical protein
MPAGLPGSQLWLPHMYVQQENKPEQKQTIYVTMVVSMQRPSSLTFFACVVAFSRVLCVLCVLCEVGLFPQSGALAEGVYITASVSQALLSLG